MYKAKQNNNYDISQPAMYKVNVLIIPKFELGTLSDSVDNTSSIGNTGSVGNTGNANANTLGNNAGGASSDGKLGEAELFYQCYFSDKCDKPNDTSNSAPVTETVYLKSGHKVHYNNGIALMVAGEGKTNATIALTTLLTDNRFDMSDAYLLGTGCAGGSYETTVMGDVVVVAAAIDYDLGHRVDTTELGEIGACNSTNISNTSVWFRDKSLDAEAYTAFNPTLTSRIYDLVKDTPLNTTPMTLEAMAHNFPNNPNATRKPHVQLGTTVSADNYWKGNVGHNIAVQMTSHYQCIHPYMTTEMEDAPLARVAKTFGMLERFISIRDVVDMDVFLNGHTPETLWGEDADFNKLVQEVNPEMADIWVTSRYNNFAVCKRIIDAIQAKKL